MERVWGEGFWGEGLWGEGWVRGVRWGVGGQVVGVEVEVVEEFWGRVSKAWTSGMGREGVDHLGRGVGTEVGEEGAAWSLGVDVKAEDWKDGV